MYVDENGWITSAHLYPADRAFTSILTRRGFFSEFNMLAKVYVLSLLLKRHAFVSVDGMNVEWDALFEARPRPLTDAAAGYVVRDRISIKDGQREAYDQMQRSFAKAALKPAVRVEQIGFTGPIEGLFADVTQSIFRPKREIVDEASAQAEALGLKSGDFFAIHIRRGDKTEGYLTKKGKLHIEGEVTGHEAYMTPILAVDERPTVFVLTDDYREVEALRASYPNARIVTLCQPEMTGYRQEIYAEQDIAAKTAQVRDLFVEVLIAREARAFHGPYLSNVSRFIHQLRHPKPSFSVDSAQAWFIE